MVSASVVTSFLFGVFVCLFVYFLMLKCRRSSGSEYEQPQVERGERSTSDEETRKEYAGLQLGEVHTNRASEGCYEEVQVSST